MKTMLKNLFVVALLVMSVSKTFAQKSQDVKYQGEFSVSTAICAAEGLNNPFNFETVHGIRVNKYVSVGFGLGFNLFTFTDNGKDAEGFLLPLFVDVKWYILDRKVSPYVSLDMGYNFGVGNHFGEYAGMYIAPGAGVSFKLKGKGAFNLGLALNNNSFGAKYVRNDESATSLAIKASIVF